MSENWSHVLRERNARYVVDAQGQPIAILLAIKEEDTACLRNAQGQLVSTLLTSAPPCGTMEV